VHPSFFTMARTISDAEHKHCFACGAENPRGLSLHFSMTENGEITGTFTPKKIYQGFEGFLHGGIICTLLDAAMTRLLIENGLSAVTADLKVRFKKPIPITEVLLIRARLEKRRRSFFQLSADLTIKGTISATATGRFLKPKEST
jgi:acyl-coenzyme A thioesterase PaaI-like protein